MASLFDKGGRYKSDIAYVSLAVPTPLARRFLRAHLENAQAGDARAGILKQRARESPGRRSSIRCDIWSGRCSRISRCRGSWRWRRSRVTLRGKRLDRLPESLTAWSQGGSGDVGEQQRRTTHQAPLSAACAIVKLEPSSRPFA